MFHWIFAAVGFIPVGWCRPNSTNRIWRNRKGWVVVFLGDVVENLADVARRTAFRSPKGAYEIRDKYGNFLGTIAKAPFDDDSPGNRN